MYVYHFHFFIAVINDTAIVERGRNIICELCLESTYHINIYVCRLSIDAVNLIKA